MSAHRRPPITNRSLAVVVAVVVVGALTAVTIPAIAGTQRPARDRGPSPADPPPVDVAAAPELLAALQRDLGLNKQRARDRLAVEAWASQTVTALRADLEVEQWGGAWLTEGAEQLMVAVTDEQAAEQVRAAGAEPTLVSHSQQELASLQTALDEHAASADQSIAGWYVDVAANTVVVLAAGGAEPAAQAFAAGSGTAGDAVRVVASDEQPRLLFDLLGGDAYFIEDQARCSIGFSVERAGEVGGGFVTAGHCNLAGTATTGFNNEAQGEFVASSFPGAGENGPDDWGVVAVNQDWVPQPLVTDFAGGTLPVAGAEEAPVGASVCKHGSTTGVTCGVIEAKNATVNYPEGTVTGLTRTDVCAEGGDSGGAWLSGDQAQGVLSGGSGDCTVGGITFFQPLTEILQENGLTLVTTADGEAPPAEGDPEPEPPAAIACEESEHTFRGRLTDRRIAQVQPHGRSYRTTSAGTHTLCLAGPSDADFDLLLQRWSGEAWETVASSEGPTANELVSFDGEAGFYRIGVTAAAGTGRYLVGIDFDAG